MKKIPLSIKILVLSLILIAPAVFMLYLYSGNHSYKRLPILGPKEAVTLPDGKTDTLYHTIPPFSFIDQDSNIVTNKDLEGHIYVADFFFVTCPSICPKMTTNMNQIYQRIDDFPGLILLSHTVNPEHDSVPVLKEYASKFNVNSEKWHFVTGNKDSIYSVAFNGYFVSVGRDSIAPGGFLHSAYFILVDPKGRIRGYYDGTKYAEVKKLMDAIKILYKEEFVPLKEK
jgi:protein SCO1/2